MKHKLLISRPVVEIKIGNSYNSINGTDAEILSASNLIKALNGEIRWGSRNEDNSKIDLLLSYKHSWSNDRIVILSQVKSGKSYGEIVNDKFFKVKKSAFDKTQRGLSTILLVWLDQEKSESYWANIYPDSKRTTTKYGANHLVTPALRFELSRIYSWNLYQDKKGGKGIIIKKVDTKDINSLRRITKQKYRKLGNVKSPLLGEIAVTNLGWNHMFRAGRSKKFKEQSFKIIPYIKILLQRMPKKYWINKFDSYLKNDYKYVQYEYVLKYSGVKDDSGKSHNIIIKLIEEIRFPENWKNESYLSQLVDRRVLLKSCSLKNE